MNTLNFSNHPCLTHSNVLKTICKPLADMGVTFFGYTALDQNGDAYCLGSKPSYASAYLERNHANSDVHYRPAFKTKRFHYHFWDFVNLDEKARSLYQMAAEFDQGHTLTVMRFEEQMTHCFHFSGSLKDGGLNQRYIEKLDQVHSFIDYFDEHRQHTQEVAAIFDHPIHIGQPKNDRIYTVVNNDPRDVDLAKVAATELRFKHVYQYYLTPSERVCLSWLRQGKSAEIIAQILGTSRKTIERHISSAKRKYDCYTLYQLGEKVYASGVAELLKKQTNK